MAVPPVTQLPPAASFAQIGATIRRFFRRFTENRLLSRALGNTGWLFGSDGISAALAIIQSVLVARLLGPSGFGALAIVVTLVTATNRLMSFRMNEFVVRYLPMHSISRGTTVKIAMLSELVTSLVAFSLLFVFAEQSSNLLLESRDAASVIRVYALIVLSTAIVESATGVLQVADRFRAIATAQVASSILTLTGVGVVFWTNGGLVEVAVAYVLGRAVPMIWLSAVGLRETSRREPGWWRSSITDLRGKGREMVGFAISTHVRGSLGMLTKDSDPVLLGFFRPPAEVGVYKLALSLVTLLTMPVNALSRAAYPEMSRLVSEERAKDLRELIRSSGLASTVWVVLAGASGLVALPWLIPMIYGKAFSSAYFAYLILALGMGLAGALFWTTPALLALGRADLPLRISIGQTTLKVALVVVLVPWGGYLAMAAILSAMYLGGSLVGRKLALNRIPFVGTGSLR